MGMINVSPGPGKYGGHRDNGRSARSALGVALASILLVGLWALPAQTVLDRPEQHEVEIAGGSDRGPVVYANDHLIENLRSLPAKRADAILVTNLQNGQRESVPFWIEGAQQVQIESATMTVSGNLLVAGTFLSSTQRDVTNNFISEVNTSGETQARYDTGSYTPERICSSDDGSFWSLGQVWPNEMNVATPYDLIRHYSVKGDFIASYLPRSALPASARLNYRNRPKGVNWAFFTCSGVGATAYLGRGNLPGFLWYQVSDKGVTSAVIRNPLFVVPTGIAATARGLYASFGKGVTGEGQPGLYELTVSDGEAPHWNLVDANRVVLLFGVRDAELVYASSPLLAGRVKVYRRKL
jgi:hypothetical protein